MATHLHWYDVLVAHLHGNSVLARQKCKCLTKGSRAKLVTNNSNHIHVMANPKQLTISPVTSQTMADLHLLSVLLHLFLFGLSGMIMLNLLTVEHLCHQRWCIAYMHQIIFPCTYKRRLMKTSSESESSQRFTAFHRSGMHTTSLPMSSAFLLGCLHAIWFFLT